MNLKRMALFSLAYLFTISLMGQTNQITGTILDEQQQPLIGATVLLLGQDSTQLGGTITNMDGKYTLNKVEGAVSLKVSFIGYEPTIVNVGNKSAIDVTLNPATMALDAVIVTALGIKREEKSLGYAVGTISNESLENSNKVSPLEALSGKVAGLNVSSSGNGAGGSTKVLIRGMNSITGSNDPLYVIDGVPIDNSGGSSGTQYGGFDYGNAANNINPEDIESISVLKGGAASALYGSRGANGVIMITTKKGTRKDGIGITLQSSISVDNPLIQPDFQNDYSQGSSGKYIGNDFKSWGEKMTGQTITNFLNQEQALTPQSEHYYSQFYNTGVNYDNSLSINKSNEKNSIYFSANWVNNQGILPNNELDKKNITARFESNLNEYITIDVKANYINQKAENRPYLSGSPDNPIYLLSLMPRSVQLDQLDPYKTLDGYPVIYTETYNQNPDGTVTWRNQPPTFASSPLLQNPYWAVNENNNNDQRNRLIGFGELSIDLGKWINLGFDLTLKTRVGIDYYTDARKKYTARNTYYKANGLATLSVVKQDVKEVNSTVMLTGGKTFDKITVNATLGGNLRQNSYRGLNSSSESGLINIDGPYVIQNFNNLIAGEGMSDREVQSVYGMLSTDYNRMVYLDFTLRNDWSSNLSPENRSFLYPSVSLSCLISEIVELPDEINFLKVRGSWAFTGSSGNYTSFRYFQYGTNPNQFHGLPYGSIPTSRPDLNITPETTITKEVGVKAILFDNRFDFDVAYYQSGTKDQILNSPLAPSSGFNSGWINGGYINNTGLEILTNYKILNNNDWSWSLGANFTRQWSEVEELAEGQDLQNIGGGAGVAVVAKMNEPVGIMLGSSYARDENGTIIIDNENLPMVRTTEEGAIDYDRIIGNSMPDILWGINSRLSYKDFYLSLSVDSKLGHDIFSLTNKVGAQYGTLAYTEEGRYEWEKAKEISLITGVPPNDGYMVHGVKDGVEGDYPADPQKYWDRLTRIQEAFVYDASFIRLRQISLGYNKNFKAASTMPFESVKVTAFVNNVAYLMRKTENISPESSFGTGNATGIEMYSQPELRNMGMSFTFTF